MFNLQHFFYNQQKTLDKKNIKAYKVHDNFTINFNFYAYGYY